jgi:uncharacterized protein (TIGR02996 family)
MTDDEAFIRAIVAAPAEDAPRLIYADWLEDRGDARGAYLRAEVASSGDSKLLQALAEKFDATWVARVSRPPFGVCLRSDWLKNVGPQLAIEQLNAFERRRKLVLPAEFRAFLMNYNGGILTTPTGLGVYDAAGDNAEVAIYSFHSLGSETDDILELEESIAAQCDPGGSSNDAERDFGLDAFLSMCRGESHYFIPIAMTTNPNYDVSLRIEKSPIGQVVLIGNSLVWGDGNAKILGDSFGSFIAALLANDYSVKS